MHEVALLSQALDLAIEAAGKEDAVRIVRIKLRIGNLAGVVPEAMGFAFDVVAKGTLAEGAIFEWEEVPVVCACASGCPDFEPEGVAVFICPKCSQASWTILQGRELDLVEIEVE